MTTLLAIAARWMYQVGPHGPMAPHGGHGGGLMPWGGAGGAGFGFLWLLVWLLILVAVVVGGVYLALHLLRDQDRGAGIDNALTVLRQRYARGEIDEEEFEERASRLTADMPDNVAVSSDQNES